MVIKNSLFSPADYRHELVNAYPELAPVCDRIGFGETMTIGEWTAAPAPVLLELARAAQPPAPALDWDLSSADISELITDIIKGHHRPLRNELQRLRFLSQNWLEDKTDMELASLAKLYQDFADNLLVHLNHEELVLFPRCIKIDRVSRLPRGDKVKAAEVTSAIRNMHAGHDETVYSLEQIKLLSDRIAHNHNNTDLEIFRRGFTAIAADLQVHTKKEEEFLLPAAIFAEDQVRARFASN